MKWLVVGIPTACLIIAAGPLGCGWPFPRRRHSSSFLTSHAHVWFTAVVIYNLLLPPTLFGLQCAKPFSTNFSCFAYDSFQNGVDGRIENWQQCAITDPNIPRPMDCVCGDTCVVNECVHAKSGGLVSDNLKSLPCCGTRLQRCALSSCCHGCTGRPGGTSWPRGSGAHEWCCSTRLNRPQTPQAMAGQAPVLHHWRRVACSMGPRDSGSRATLPLTASCAPNPWLCHLAGSGNSS